MDIDGDNDLTEFLGMTSFTYFGAGSSISDPDLEEYVGSLQFYNLMEDYLPRPEYPAQVAWTDLATGNDTKFVLLETLLLSLVGSMVFNFLQAIEEWLWLVVLLR